MPSSSSSHQQAQLSALNRLLEQVRQRNSFYVRKWREAGAGSAPISSLADLASLPLTTRDELLADQAAAPPLGTNLSVPFEACKRFHRSSGTTRAPLFWTDSMESWEWVIDCSQHLWRLAGVTPVDRVLFLMPFGAFSGPSIMFEGACRLGCAAVPAGLPGVDEQLRWLIDFQPSVVAGKPGVLQTLAVRAKADGVALRRCGVRKLILGGEHSPPLRDSLEQLWGAECFDRYGLTEAGSVAGECTAHSGALHLLDHQFIAESIGPRGGTAVAAEEMGELVLTSLGRVARPIIRYRTGDLVRLIPDSECACGIRGPMLFGGVMRRRVG